MEPEQSNRIKKQKILILLCCLVYSFAYAGRYSYNANITPIINFYNVSNKEAGLIGSFFFFAYGAGQLLNAIFCKYYNKKYIIPAALCASVAINAVMFFCPPFWTIKFLWLLNGICQSVLWPTLLQVLGESIDESMTRWAVLAMSASILIGTFVAYGGSALFNLGSFFRGSFLLGILLMAAIGIIWLLFYGTLTAEKPVLKKEAQSAANEGKERVVRTMTAALIGLLAVCAIFAIVDNFIKDGFNTWMPKILKDQFGFGDSIAIVLTLVLPFFGVFGSMLAMRTNKWLKDFRTLMGFFYLILSVCLCGLLFSMRKNVLIPFLLCQGAISCLLHAINAVLTAIMPLALREKMNSGFLAGLMNTFCYVGSTASSYGLGAISDHAGWDAAIITLLATAAGAMVLAAIVTVINVLHRKKTEKTENEVAL